MDMRQHLPEIPHVELCPADRAISEMIGLGFGDHVRIDAGTARDYELSSFDLVGGKSVISP
jgi:hypothetical protein